MLCLSDPFLELQVGYYKKGSDKQSINRLRPGDALLVRSFFVVADLQLLFSLVVLFKPLTQLGRRAEVFDLHQSRFISLQMSTCLVFLGHLVSTERGRDRVRRESSLT